MGSLKPFVGAPKLPQHAVDGAGQPCNLLEWLLLLLNYPVLLEVKWTSVGIFTRPGACPGSG